MGSCFLTCAKYPHLKLPALPVSAPSISQNLAKYPSKRFLASELCSRDWRGPSGQVSSLKSTPYQNFCAGSFWENSSGKLGLKAGTAWPDRWHPLVMGSGLLLNLSSLLPLLPWDCLSMPTSRDSPTPPCAETAVFWCFSPTNSCWISLLSGKPCWATFLSFPHQVSQKGNT